MNNLQTVIKLTPELYANLVEYLVEKVSFNNHEAIAYLENGSDMYFEKTWGSDENGKFRYPKEFITRILDGLNICENSDLETDLDTSDLYDQLHETIDGIVDIYNYDLWKTAHIFKNETEDAISEGLVDMNDFSFEKAFQCGQYECYRNEAQNVLNCLAEWLADS